MLNELEITQAGEDGFKSGLNWPDAWMNHGKPGGPYVPSRGYDEKSHIVHAQRSSERMAWLNGWEAGLAKKIKIGRTNPLLGTDNNAKYHAQKENNAPDQV